MSYLGGKGLLLLATLESESVGHGMTSYTLTSHKNV